MIDLRITKDRLKNHFYYFKWIYLAALLVSVFAFNILYDATEPQTPDTQKVDIFVLGYYLSGDYMSWETEILAALPSDQVEVNFLVYSSDTMSDSSFLDLVETRIATHQGDIYLMDTATYQLLATTGAFLPLDRTTPDGGTPFLDRITLPDSVDTTLLKTDFEAVDDSGTHYYDNAICGVSLSCVRGILELGAVPDDMVAAVTTYSANQTNALTALQWIFDNKQETTLTVTPAPTE